MPNTEQTMQAESVDTSVCEAKQTLQQVYHALKEKGYDPVSQIVGYLLTEDPTYITNYGGARSLIRRIDRNDLLEEIVRNYFNLS